MHPFESNYRQIGRTGVAMETCGAETVAMCPCMTSSLFYSLQSKTIRNTQKLRRMRLFQTDTWFLLQPDLGGAQGRYRLPNIWDESL